MLAITLGVALILTVAGPTLRALDTPARYQLFGTCASVAVGMLLVAGWTIGKRYHLGRQCGPLLLSLPLHTRRPSALWRWLWLLLLLPGFVFIIYFLTGKKHDVLSIRQMLHSFLMTIMYSHILTITGLRLWTQGYSNGLEFCQHGILCFNHFHAWSAPALRDLAWGQSDDKLVLNINRTVTTVPVPAEQREGVEAILQHYYRAATGATDPSGTSAAGNAPGG
jgi:hypothetical protein